MTGQAGMAETSGTFLRRLVRDVRGNTLAIVAAALIPLAGMVGGGIDMSRMYITKTRLQHACDAGALAGRKQMGSGSWGTDDNAVADQFFNANFQDGSYGSMPATHSFTENAGKVIGTASAVLPMTLMKVLGRTSETLAVTCNAEMRLPNTDIMFVLDTTGSMGQKAVSTDTDTKIVALKTAVKCFYEIVARLDTDANCTTGTPSGGTGSQVQIRFGFVPYSTNVNVGKLLPPGYFADTWSYQSRVGRWWVVTKVNQNQTSTISQTGVAQTSCNTDSAKAAGNPYYYREDTYSTTSTPYPNGTTRRIKKTDTVVTGWSATNSTCTGTQTKSDIEYTLTEGATPTANDIWEDWHYGKVPQRISDLKNGTGWNNTFQSWTGNGGTQRTITWDGCIEERPTVAQASYSPIPTDAHDLDIDMLPAAGDAGTLWGPALREMIFPRAVTTSWAQGTTAESWTKTDYYNNIPYYCPTEAKKLQPWADPTAFDSYVDSLTPSGNTYHDIGMIWGARFMSPTGIFASENALTPKGGQIDRHIIFMTDGDAQSSPCDYAAYGVAFWDQRTTTDVGTADHCTDTQRQSLNDQINARLTALCTAVRNKNISLWVISFGSGSNTTTENRLSNCATPGRYFAARDAATLQSTFASIANQISQLRLTQ
jgi:Flp pilus assembly protein TadG